MSIGTRTGGQSTDRWKVPHISTRLIHITIDPREPGRNYPHTLPVVADAKVALQRLLAGISEHRTPGDWVASVQAEVARWRAAKSILINSDTVPIRPERVCAELSKVLPERSVVVADTGYDGAWAGAFVEFASAGRRFIRCEGSLGWALPASIGVKAALPDQSVVAIMGDGGFWYHFAELETAVRYGINVVMIVLNNHALVSDTHILDLQFQSRAYELAELQDVDFGGVARALGAEGIRVTDPNSLHSVLADVLRADTTTVIDVVIEHDAAGPVTDLQKSRQAPNVDLDDYGDVVAVHRAANTQ
jgi:acetolactate synthase-1/2/3 large subunit